MINWNDSMLIGIPQVDDQHKALMEATNRLMDACNLGKGRMEIEKILNFVVAYTLKHFRDEETIQAKLGFPGAISHKWIHTQLIHQVGALVQEFKQAGPSIAFVKELNHSFGDCIFNHIKSEDIKFGEYISKANKVPA